MSVPVVNTLEAIAVHRYYEAVQTKDALRAARDRQAAHACLAQLRVWSGLSDGASAPDTYPFKWQGYWFQPADPADLACAEVEMFGWDSEQGWGWWSVRSIFDIGERICEWTGVEHSERPRLVRNAVTTPIGRYLPDRARDLLPAQQEA